MRILLITILSFFFLKQEGQITKVIDGDTVHATIEGKDVTIRLNAIDAPESDQFFGSEATAYLNQIILNKNVEIKILTKDRYGRSIANIYLDGIWINMKLIEKGYAWHYIAYDKNPDLISAQAKAYNDKVGLWKYPNPIEPWKWRKKDNNPKSSNNTQYYKGSRGGCYYINNSGNKVYVNKNLCN